MQVPRSNAGTSPRVVLSLGIVLSLGGGDDGRALAVGSTAVQYRGVDRGRDPGKLRRGRGGDRASTRGNGCGGGPRTPCGARTRCRYAVARKARTGLPWVSSPGGLGTLGGRAWPWALPRQREKGLPGEGSRNLRGVKLRRKGEGQKGPRGRGLPAGIPEAQPAAPGLSGRVGGHQTATATAATAYLWRRGPATQGQPRPSPGPHGARRPGKPPGRPRRNRGGAPRPPAGGVGGGGRRGPRALRPLGPSGARSPRGEKPPSWVRPPAAQPPGPTGPGVFFLSVAS